MHEGDNGRSFGDDIDRETKGWKPDPGDKIVGRIVDVGERDSDYGGSYPVLTVRPEPDEGVDIAVHGFHTVLKNELAKLEPRVEERIAIKYLGTHAKGYENYRVRLDRHAAAQTPDWSRMRTQAEAMLGAQYQPGDTENVPVGDAPDDEETF
jgi:hypothetical protein